jgi:beta-fructofuranosidase
MSDISARTKTAEMSEAAAGRASASRPRYHITAPRNWLSDPNGPMKHDGRYHLFYQYNPIAPVWGSPHWGHVSSTDLAHWTDHPVALTPRPEAADRDGCWSGCARLIGGQPTIFYTGVVEVDGVRTESVCVAHGSADLITWQPEGDPVIPSAPPEITGRYHRDPFLIPWGGGWRMLLGSGLFDGQRRSGALLMYESTDLHHWDYRGVIYQRRSGEGPSDTGPLWECPQVLAGGEGDVLIFAVQMEDEPHPLRCVAYAIGQLHEDRFESRSLGKVDHGNVLYAPALLSDGARTLMWCWVQERGDRVGADHAGALSLPRTVEPREGRLLVQPAPELVSLRLATLAHGDLAGGDEISLVAPLDVAGRCEIVATVPGGGHGGIELRADGQLAYRLIIDDRRGVAEVTTDGESPVAVPLWPTGGKSGRRLRLFVDASIYELFLDDEISVTNRYYGPTPDTLRSIELGTGHGLRDVQIHRMGDCLPGREGD